MTDSTVEIITFRLNVASCFSVFFTVAASFAFYFPIIFSASPTSD